jgi:hypothetical protein
MCLGVQPLTVPLCTCSAVDQHTAIHIFSKCIRGMLKDKAVLWITHQLELLPQCVLPPASPCCQAGEGACCCLAGQDRSCRCAAAWVRQLQRWSDADT